MRKLNGEQTKEMIKFTCQNPSIRENKIQRSLEILNYRRNEYLQQFGMQISNEMAVVGLKYTWIIDFNKSHLWCLAP
jgi:Argonaute linker 2 domain